MPSIEPLLVVAMLGCFVATLGLFMYRDWVAVRENAQQMANEISEKVNREFLVQPCSRCHEFTMSLLEISPNGRSVHYQCLHCKKKMRAAAGTPLATQVIDVWSKLCEITSQYNLKASIVLTAPAAPLPFEQTTRQPISEAVRSEVWRRDGGCCVECGTNQNLQFDHIIPVSRGGATTVVNLQLLCQSCNGSKSNKI